MLLHEGQATGEHEGALAAQAGFEVVRTDGPGMAGAVVGSVRSPEEGCPAIPPGEACPDVGVPGVPGDRLLRLQFDAQLNDGSADPSPHPLAEGAEDFVVVVQDVAFAHHFAQGRPAVRHGSVAGFRAAAGVEDQLHAQAVGPGTQVAHRTDSPGLGVELGFHGFVTDGHIRGGDELGLRCRSVEIALRYPRIPQARHLHHEARFAILHLDGLHSIGHRYHTEVVELQGHPPGKVARVEHHHSGPGIAFHLDAIG